MCEYIAEEIAHEFGVPPERPRTKYRVLPRISRDEPEPPEWFLPPESHKPPSPSHFAHRRHNVTPDAANDDTASRESAAANDEAASQRQPREELH